MEQIPLDLIDENLFNSRKYYDEIQIRQLASSLEKVGQLSAVKVRRHNDRYQLIYGHRRVRAAKLLKWSTIKAEISECSDETMLELSLVENVSRKDLSDYEIGLAFSRMQREFGKSQERIGEAVGYSRTHVCNLIRMTELIDEQLLLKDQSLRTALCTISEHHARVLAQITNSEDRVAALRIVVAEQLSVRETQKIIQRFRSWFTITNSSGSNQHLINVAKSKPYDFPQERWRDIQEIQHALTVSLELPAAHDFKSFADLHAYDVGFTMFANSAPYEMLEDENAIEKEKDWFYSIAPSYSTEMRDLRVRLFDTTALATFYIDYRSNRSKRAEMTVRGSVLFANSMGSWRIVHEHWSTVGK